MSAGEDDTEKEHEPSQKRLDDARKRGEIPRSTDITTAASYGGFLLASVTLGQESLRDAGTAAMSLLAGADRLAPLMVQGAAAPVSGILMVFAKATAPFFLFPAAAALAAIVVQNALVFSGEKVMPKLSRISLVSGIKNRLGRAGLFEFGKSVVKLVLLSLIVGICLFRDLDEILGTVHGDAAPIMSALMDLLVDFLFIVLMFSTVIGGLDYLWQRMEHLRRNRMSRQELIDEMKGSEGDPQMKAQRRQRGYDIATNRMLVDVAKADVVLVNPTHYAVALKWSRGERRAPVCVAKGVDEVAARIRQKAAEAGVPLHRDPPTARALHATVKLGEEIRPEHYRAVAAAIRFAEAMRRKRKAKQ